MSKDTPETTAGWRASLWGYNLRILLGNTYWLVVTPVVATQLVIFWNMATSSLFSATRAAQTIELLAPILGAFLCAHALAPEQDGAGELVFVRPLSLEKVLLLRLAMIFGFVFAILVPAFVIYSIGIGGFPLGLVMLAALPSMLFLSALAMAVASATRHPLLGLGAAGAFWALDFATGGYYNPVLTLHRFADHLADQPMSEQWVLSKLLLLVLAVACYLWNRRLLGRPAAPRRWAAAVRTASVVVLLAAVYVVSGAGYKVAYGLRHEREMGPRALFWYQQQFRGYGLLPVARVFGPAFPLYVQSQESGPAAGPGGGQGDGFWASFQVSRMEELVKRYPGSIWADNAQLAIAVHAGRQQAARPWLVIACQAGEGEPARRLVEEDVDHGLRELAALVDRYPKSPFAAIALSRMAQIGVTTLDYGLARDAYERIIKEHASAPEAHEAGMKLSALYLGEGEPELAQRAADIAAGVALWDVAGEAWLAGARAAQEAGDREGARRRYERARGAAEEGRERSIRGEKSPSQVPKQEQFQRYDAVVHACERALSGELRPTGAPPPVSSRARGLVVSPAGSGADLRVAIGAGADAEGFPSPFAEGPAVSAMVNADGTFEMESLPSGRYPVFAVALRVSQGEAGWGLAPPPLPIAVGGAPAVIPPAVISGAAEVERPGVRMEPPRPGPRAASQGSSDHGEHRRGRGTRGDRAFRPPARGPDAPGGPRDPRGGR